MTGFSCVTTIITGVAAVAPDIAVVDVAVDTDVNADVEASAVAVVVPTATELPQPSICWIEQLTASNAFLQYVVSVHVEYIELESTGKPSGNPIIELLPNLHIFYQIVS